MESGAGEKINRGSGRKRIGGVGYGTHTKQALAEPPRYHRGYRQRNAACSPEFPRSILFHVRLGGVSVEDT